MKHLFISLSFLLFMSSCSNDVERDRTYPDAQSGLVLSRLGGANSPDNTDNAYDAAGRIHNEIVIAYYDRADLPLTVAKIINDVDSICNGNNSFLLIKRQNYAPPTAARVNYLIGLDADCISDITDGSGLSPTGKTSLKTFVASLIELEEGEDDFTAIYDFITNYESSVITSSLSAADKEIILTTSSIARHSLFLKKKRPKKNMDPDWDWMTANIMAGTDGASIGTAEAISRAVATGIADNK